MKEYLTKNSSGNYQLVNHRFSEDDIEVPDGADAAFKKQYGDGLCFFQCIGENGADWCSETRKWISRIHPIDDWYFKNSPWQREKESIIDKLVDDGMKFDGDKPQYTQPEELPFVDSLNDQYAEIERVRKHRHYFKDVSNIAEIDVYTVLKLFDVTDPCLQHIVKKALCAGKRGHKDMMEDLQNIVDTAIRAVELNSQVRV